MSETNGDVTWTGTTTGGGVEAKLWTPNEWRHELLAGDEGESRPWDSRVVGELAAVAGRPWCLKPDSMEMIRSALTAGMNANEMIPMGEQPPPWEKHGAVGVVPLHGLITPRGGGLLGALLGMGGGLSDFHTGLRQAVADEDVKHIVLDVNSPGGLVDQVPETAAAVRHAREFKPISAVASTQAASAAYWIASQADDLAVTPSGEVGSIGCYMIHVDKSEHLAKEGLNVTLTSAGRYKTEASHFGPLSEEAKGYQQRKVDRFYDRFVADVAAGRRVSPESVRNGYGEGRTLLADDAVEQGLADRVATTDQVMVESASRVQLEGRVQHNARSRAMARVDALIG